MGHQTTARGRSTALGAAILLAFVSTPSLAQAPASPSDYHLGPEDKLRIKVYDWRRDRADAHEWTALTGEFTVGASGSLFLPLVGSVPARDRSLTDVARDIAAGLQQRFGLAERPDASVEIAEYRPFYVEGQVDKAGAYPFRPGLTVRQAIAIAGGLSRLRDTSLLGFERDALATRGELRVLQGQRLMLLARQARFDAEIAGADAIVFPSDLASRKGDPDVARAMREEEALFATSRDTLAKQLESLGKRTDLLQHEILALAAKETTLSHQIDLAKKELETVAGLVNKGLTIVPRQLALEESVAQYESSRLDIQLATLRARQDLAKVDREATEVREARRTAALTEAREVMAKLAAATTQIETAETLIYQAEVRAPEVLAREREAGRSRMLIRITRTTDRGTVTEEAAEDDAIAPGDTVSIGSPAEPQRIGDRL